MAENNNKNKRELKAILFADVVNYTRLMQKHEEDTHSAIIELIDLFAKGCEEYDGEVLEIRGDGIFALFSSALNSVKFASKTQNIVEKLNENCQENRKIRFRVGVHLGDVIKNAHYHYGDSVNIAARIENLAEPGGICISNAIYQQIKHTRDFGYEFLGTKQLKNIEDEMEIYRITKKSRAAVMIASPRELPKDNAVEDAYKPSVIFIPFRNRGNVPNNDYFSDGVSDDIITLLSKFKHLMVIGRTTAFAYKATQLTARQINRQINVQYIVDGSVRMAGRRVRITVDLVDSRREHTIWSERYDRHIDDIFDVQDEIAETISAAVAVKIETQSSRTAMQRPSDLFAYDCLLQGQQHLFRYTKNDNDKARQLYRAAMQRDPQYARALAAISRTHNLDWRYAWRSASEEPLQQAMQLAKSAVQIDSNDARGLSELAYTYLYNKLHDLSIATYKRAINITPNDPDILSDMADALAHSGQSKAALAMMKKAICLNPFYPDQYLWHLGGTQFNLRQYEDVVATVNQANNPKEGERLLAASYAYMGETEKARWYASRVLKAHPNFSLDHWSKILPDRYEEDTQHYIEGLRMAGLK